MTADTIPIAHVVNPGQPAIQLTPSTMAKFKKIEKLVNDGKIKYADMKSSGITTHLYSKWKKYNQMTQQRA